MKSRRPDAVRTADGESQHCRAWHQRRRSSYKRRWRFACIWSYRSISLFREARPPGLSQEPSNNIGAVGSSTDLLCRLSGSRQACVRWPT